MTTPAPILMTGFEAFGSAEVNPTQLMMEAVARDPGIVAAVLPVAYRGAAEHFVSLMETHRPAAVLCFGLSERTDYIVIERLAWNRDESPSPDNAGEIREDQAIIEGGPSAYGGTVPVPMLLRELALAGLPVTFGDHAGGFVCNHLFYTARHYMDVNGVTRPMAFMHMPPLPQQVASQAGRRGLALERQILAARTAANWLRSHYNLNEIS